MHRMTSTPARPARRAAAETTAHFRATDEQQITGMSVTTLNPQLTGKCPDCKGDFESCTCTGAVPAPRAGVADDIRREDDRKGYERDETDQFHQIVRHLVDDGDRRAEVAGHRARRTLAEMAPEYVRQSVLVLHRPSMNDACPVCTRWNCDPSNCPPGFAPAPASAAPARDGGGPMSSCGHQPRLVTVNHVGADGKPYQTVTHEPCQCGGGAGQKS